MNQELNEIKPVETTSSAKGYQLDTELVFIQLRETIWLETIADAYVCTVSDIIELAKESFTPDVPSKYVKSWDYDHERAWDDETWGLSLVEKLDFALGELSADAFFTVKEAVDYFIKKAPKGYFKALRALDSLERGE